MPADASSPRPKKYANHTLVDSDIESDAASSEARVPSERDSLLPRVAIRRRASSDSSFYRCDDQHRVTGNDRENAVARRRLYAALAISLTFFFLELAAGIISGSLALLSDSFHLLSDVAGFIISLIALTVAELPATSKYSYGFHRVEILGAILSTSLIWALTAGLVWEAVQRINKPEPIDGKMMVVTAAVGVVVNIVLAVVLGGHGHSHGPGGHDHSHGEDGHESDAEEGHAHYGSISSPTREEHDHAHGEEGDHDGHGHDHDHGANGSAKPAKKKHENINVSSAAVHVIGDIVSSVGVLIAGIVIYFYPHLTIVDPICTFLFSAIVLFTTFRIINTTIAVLMESTPHDIDPEKLTADLLAIPGVVSCHELHLWSLTVGKASMSVHLGCSSATIVEYNRILNIAQKQVCSRYGIHHTTIQLEAAPEGEEERRFTGHCAPAVCATE